MGKEFERMGDSVGKPRARGPDDDVPVMGGLLT